MHSIKTQGKFESAHRLQFYKGKCNRLHGHNWRVEAILESWDLDSNMVADFKILDLILAEYDHKILLFDTAENQAFFQSIPKSWIEWLDFEPTAENLSKYFFKELKERCPVELHFLSVRVWESEGKYARYASKLGD